MHLVGAAECAVSSQVFVTTYISKPHHTKAFNARRLHQCIRRLVVVPPISTHRKRFMFHARCNKQRDTRILGPCRLVEARKPPNSNCIFVASISLHLHLLPVLHVFNMHSPFIHTACWTSANLANREMHLEQAGQPASKEDARYIHRYTQHLK
jgi:hypothetical protein